MADREGRGELGAPGGNAGTGEGPLAEPRPLIVAVDGPAGAGKSTLARRLAIALGLPYVNTGEMYRAVAARALATRTDPADDASLARLAASLRFRLADGPVRELRIDRPAGDPPLTDPAVESVVSRVAAHPAVRSVLVRAQRSLGATGCVMEGRDIGRVVFPTADVKVFLSAASGVRASRRTFERGGAAEAGEAVGRRDAADTETNPLVPADGAFVLDTTGRTPEESSAEALRIVRRAAEDRERARSRPADGPD